jgi:hypothetical protein
MVIRSSGMVLSMPLTHSLGVVLSTFLARSGNMVPSLYMDSLQYHGALAEDGSLV